MEVVCDLSRLRKVLGFVAHAVPTRSPKPALQNLRLTASGESLTVEGTDLEVAVRYRLEPVAVKKPGVCLAPARPLGDFVRDTDGQEIVLQHDGSSVSLRSGSDSGTLTTADEAEFPTVPPFEERGGAAIDGGSFVSMAARTTFAAAREAGRYAMNGVLIEADKDRLRLVATDGRRLALTDRPVDAGPEKKRSAIVPVRGIEQFRRAVEAMDDRSKGVQLAIADREVALRAGAAEVFSRVLEGEFPKYSSVIPKDPPNVAEIDRRLLLHRLKCVSSFAADDARAVRFRFSASGLAMTSRSATGEGRSEMEARFRGTGTEIAFNPDYVRDALQAAEGTSDGDAIRFEFSDRTSPGKFVFGEDFFYVVMPIAVEG